MGGPKALLSVGRSSLIERQFELLSPLFDNLYVAVKDAALLDQFPHLSWQGTITDPPGARCLMDVIGNAIGVVGRPIFLAAVDIPVLNRTIVSEICSRHEEGKSIVPVDEKRPQPLAAVWDPQSLKYLEPPDKDLTILAWVRRCGAALMHWPTDFPQSTKQNEKLKHPFRNLNTPEDLLRLESEN